MATYIENEEETEPIEEIEQPDETEDDTEGEIYPVEVEVENGKVIYDEPFDFEKSSNFITLHK